MSDDNKLKPFIFEEGTEIRVLTREGEPWFLLADVCQVLEIANSRRAASRLDGDEKGVHTVNTLGGAQEMTIINESGLYSLILTSRKAEAKRFKKWVTAEVLPAIRRDGGYMAVKADETPEELALRAMTVMQSTIDRQRAQIETMAPKVVALDRIALADGDLTITAAAKALQVRPKDLFGRLSAEHWIYRRAGGKSWLGYQDRIQAGLLTHKVTTVARSDGSEKMVEQVLLTPKGLTKLAQLGMEGLH